MIYPLLILSASCSVMATFPTRLIYQSPTGLFIENIAVRPSSELLLTSVASSTLYMLDPGVANATLREVYTFPNSTGLLGIVEYQPDVYAVVASTLNLTTRRTVPGTVSTIWRIDLRTRTVAATPIVGIPQSKVLNGLTVVPEYPDLLLAADSDIGAVYEVRVSEGTARVAIQDASMAAGTPAPSLGINGLHIRGNELYFSNSDLQTFARVPVSVASGSVKKAGAVQVLRTVQPPKTSQDRGSSTTL
jgi:hypothetical protein